MLIVRLPEYERALERLGAAEADIATVERMIAENPKAGVVIPGLSGLRKIRFGLAGRGKRGGGRGASARSVYSGVWWKNWRLIMPSDDVNENPSPPQDRTELGLSIEQGLREALVHARGELPATTMRYAPVMPERDADMEAGASEPKPAREPERT